jgi:hypothetical protein
MGSFKKSKIQYLIKNINGSVKLIQDGAKPENCYQKNKNES